MRELPLRSEHRRPGTCRRQWGGPAAPRPACRRLIPRSSSRNGPARTPSRGRCRFVRYDRRRGTAIPAPFPPRLAAPGTADAPFEPLLDASELAPGTMTRVSRGDLDILLAHTPNGIVAVDDRCPHMAAPLSIGTLDGCVVACPLHEGQFDLCSGRPGPDADDRRPRSGRRLPPDLVAGRSRAEGRPAGQEGRGAPADAGAAASATTRCGSSTAGSRSRLGAGLAGDDRGGLAQLVLGRDRRRGPAPRIPG